MTAAGTGLRKEKKDWKWAPRFQANATNPEIGTVFDWQCDGLARFLTEEVTFESWQSKCPLWANAFQRFFDGV